MKMRAIGSLEVPVVGLGCNNFGPRLDRTATCRVLDAAIAEGVTFLDTADVYGDGDSERFLGACLRGRRSEVILATKFGHPRGGAGRRGHPEHVRRAVHDSLERLQTDHIDLYILHRPDPDVPIADTLGAMSELVREGVVRELGVSGFGADALEEAVAATPPGAPRIVNLQNEYSLLHRAPERGVLAACDRTGVAFVPYFPLASGLLTGTYRLGRPLPSGTRLTSGDRHRDALSRERLAQVEALARVAEAHGSELLDLAFAWLLAQQSVASVIAGASAPEQVRRNAAAATWDLPEGVLGEVDAALAGAGAT